MQMSETRTTYIKLVLRELIAAFVVLAIMLWPLSHVAVTAAPVGSDIGLLSAINASFCGDGSGYGDHAGEGPCHACRVDAIDLPHPCPDVEPVQFAGRVVSYVMVDEAAHLRLPTVAYAPRGPPFAI